MRVRADHLAGAFFICVGALVIALSGDLPFGTLSFPGSGFMPRILAVLTIFFGIVLALRASESKPIAELTWTDAAHAGMVIGITAVAVLLFDWLGFLVTDILLIFALLMLIERKHFVPAAVYSIGVVVITYVLFVHVLKTPLNAGAFGI